MLTCVSIELVLRPVYHLGDPEHGIPYPLCPYYVAQFVHTHDTNWGPFTVSMPTERMTINEIDEPYKVWLYTQIFEVARQAYQEQNGRKTIEFPWMGSARRFVPYIRREG